MVLPSFEERKELVSPERVGRLFSARSVALVGASETSNWAVNAVRNLNRGGGVKDLRFVHPKHSRLFDQACFPSMRDLDAPVDLAFLMVGPNRVESVLEDAAAVGVKSAVVLAAGYGETGDEGRRLQQSLAQRAIELDITVLGPNTIGYINAADGVSPWGVVCDEQPLAGPVGAVFESGSMARATLDFAQARGVGSTVWASLGNSAVLSSMDVLEYLIEDDATRCIALFLESVREPDRLFELGHRALEANKPVVVFKAGRSEHGMRSAMAHTGAVATDDAIADAAFKQAGIIRVESIEELISTAGLFGYSPRLPAGRRMGVVTSSGGGCNIIADHAVSKDIELPEWSEATVEKLRTELPAFASVLNPLDTTGFGHARPRPRPTKAEDDLLEMAVTDPGIDFAYSMMTPLPAERPTDPNFIESRLQILGEIARRSPVPVFLSSNTCMDVHPYTRELLASNGLYLLPGVELALSSLGYMLRWVDQRARLTGRRRANLPRGLDDRPLPTGAWAEDEGRAALVAVGVPVVPARLATSPAEAADASAHFGAAVVLKICSRDIAHKSDVGGVMLGVDGPAATAEAFTTITDSIAATLPEADVRGVLVSPMREPGIELLVGVTVDPTFGPVLAVGIGGIWVEVLRDVSLRVLPVDAVEVREMLEELRGADLLHGARGGLSADLDAVAETIAAIAQAALEVGERLETLEVNPLRIRGSHVEALDVLVVTAPERSCDSR